MRKIVAVTNNENEFRCLRFPRASVQRLTVGAPRASSTGCHWPLPFVSLEPRTFDAIDEKSSQSSEQSYRPSSLECCQPRVFAIVDSCLRARKKTVFYRCSRDTKQIKSNRQRVCVGDCVIFSPSFRQIPRIIAQWDYRFMDRKDPRVIESRDNSLLWQGFREHEDHPESIEVRQNIHLFILFTSRNS